MEKEELKISKKHDHLKIKGCVYGYEFLDEATNMKVIFVPALDISGYGKTSEEANEMVRFSIDFFMKNLIVLPIKSIKAELSKLGWTNQILHTKVYHPNFNPTDKLTAEGISDYTKTEIPLAA